MKAMAKGCSRSSIERRIVMNIKRKFVVPFLWVISSLLIAAFASAQTTPASLNNAAGGAVAPELEGTWLVTVTISDGPPPFPSLVTYARGGALTATDGGVSPASGNVYQGTWTRTGPHEYAFTFLGLQYDAKGIFSNYLRAHETLRLEPGGNGYNGLTKIEVLDTAQNVLETFSATTHATPIRAR
jgi:hypothetical protein